jgi:hypothetical protein
LVEQYDKEMTIVLQNQFANLRVSETGFEVDLSFDGRLETLGIPFSAIKGFFDPSVQFGLQFDVDRAAIENAEAMPPAVGAPAEALATASRPAEAGGEKIVSLDSFRKK